MFFTEVQRELSHDYFFHLTSAGERNTMMNWNSLWDTEKLVMI